MHSQWTKFSWELAQMPKVSRRRHVSSNAKSERHVYLNSVQIYVLENAGIFEWFRRYIRRSGFWSRNFLLSNWNWSERCGRVNRNWTCVDFLRMWLVFLFRFSWTRRTKVIFTGGISTEWVKCMPTRFSVYSTHTNVNRLDIRLNRIITTQNLINSMYVSVNFTSYIQKWRTVYDDQVTDIKVKLTIRLPLLPTGFCSAFCPYGTWPDPDCLDPGPYTPPGGAGNSSLSDPCAAAWVEPSKKYDF